MKSLNIVDQGLINYTEGLRLQKQLVQDRIDKKINDTLVLCEHSPVITLGRKSGKDEFLVPKKFLSDKKIDIFEIERGGEATYHGPGQMIGYPIIGLLDTTADIHKFLRSIETTLLFSLKEIGLKPVLRKGLTGIWIKKQDNFEKLAFIGISAKKWVTYHGFSVNIDCDLQPFSWIIPCGMKGAKITSIKECLGAGFTLKLKKEFKNKVIKNFKKIFHYA